MTPEQILYGLALVFVTALIAPLGIMLWTRVFGKRDGATQAADTLSGLVGRLSEQLAESEKEKQIIIGQKDAIIAHQQAQLVELLQAGTRDYDFTGRVRATPTSVEFHDMKTQPVPPPQPNTE